MATKAPLVVIVGETGSGKSALSMELAEQFNGEIIAADSRTIYKGMDIGTAKPTKADQAKVKHYLIDIIEPNQTFSAAKFKEAALEAIRDITNRNKLPFLVGGTGLYVDSVIYDFSFNPNGEKDKVNPRHLADNVKKDQELRPNILIIGLNPDRTTLKMRLNERTEQMFQEGIIKETQELLAQYPPDLEAFKTPGYKALISYISGDTSLEQAKALFVQGDMNLAKRQRTWFKRNKSIHWLNNREEAKELITTFLNT